jgi:hypothetical protein
MFAPAVPAVPTSPSQQPASGKGAGSRAGKKPLPFWTPEAAKKQLDFMVVEMDTTAQALITEALNDLFKKYGKPPIA